MVETMRQGHLFQDLFGGSVLTGGAAWAAQKNVDDDEKKRSTAFHEAFHPETFFSSAQMSKKDAQRAFIYTTDGRLWWKNKVGRRRPEAGAEVYRKRRDDNPVWAIRAGDRVSETRYMRRYLVWNWHFGGTDRILLPANGDPLDDRIENIVLGDLLPTVRLEPFAAVVPHPETGTQCPCCGGLAPVLSPNLLARAYQLPPQQEAILTRVWAGKGKAVTGEAIVAEMYTDDLDGGPEPETARKYFKTQLCLLRARLKGSGVMIEPAGYQRGFRIVIEQKG